MTLDASSIPYLRPELPPLDAVGAYYRRSEAAHRYSNFGPCHELLVTRLGEHVGRGARCIPVASCTLGLMVALRALAGEATRARPFVLAPSYTFPATAQAIVWAGFAPLFVDVEPSSWHVDPASLVDAIERHGGEIAAVLACSTFGVAPPRATRDAWHRVCRSAGLPLLVDSAPGWGSRDEDGLALGLQGEAEVFSFHATKALAIGEGGVIVTRDHDLASMLKRLINFGFGDDAGAVLIGLNAKLSEIQAATALAALDQLERVVQARQSYAAKLRSELEPRGFSFQPGSERSAWSGAHALAPTPAIRDAVLAAGSRRAIEFRRYYDPPLHRTPPFAASRSVPSLEATENLAARALSIPIANDYDDVTIDAIVDCIASA